MKADQWNLVFLVDPQAAECRFFFDGRSCRPSKGKTCLAAVRFRPDSLAMTERRKRLAFSPSDD